MSRRERRIMRAAGFTRAERRAFLIAWDTPGEDLDCEQAQLIVRFYFAAAEDPDDVVSLAMLATAQGHAELLEMS